ncbi:MAG: tyrosine--tRNA ligase [Mycoplasmoidaceae bacterium]
MDSVLNELKKRNMLSQLSSEEKFNDCIKNNKAVYIGFDPSFKSLHLGNYVMIRVLKIFEKFNIKSYALCGGATGQIGDPSGKNDERKLLEKNELIYNFNKIKEQISYFIDSKYIVDNYSFYKDFFFIDFLREIGKEFTVNYLIAKDLIKTRLDSGISFAEFSYTLIQAYDFYFLFSNYNIGIQCGGSDQWGNITSGLELIRKKNGIESCCSGITINLLLKSDGTKFGKSEKGAIYLDKNVTSVYDMYQYLVNQNDDDIENVLKFLSSFEIQEIDEIMRIHLMEPQKRYSQKMLAKNVITEIHGKNEYDKVLKISNILFTEKYHLLEKNDISNYFKFAPNFTFKKIPLPLIDLIVENNIVKSRRLARELFDNSSIKINGAVVNDSRIIIKNSDLLCGRFLILKKGKKNFYIFNKIK